MNNDWQQHFPTYSFSDRDIALEEYKTSAKNLESEERVFINATNIAIISAAGLGSLAVGYLDKFVNNFGQILPESIILMVLLFVGGFSIITIRYFADRQKSIVFSARKVIVLRRMLGLSYGNIQLVLPNWRVEGADEPFAVRLFPGWNTYVTYPFYALTGISSVVMFFLTAFMVQVINTPKTIFALPIWFILICFLVIWIVFLAYIYRKALFDTHENSLLLFGRNVASLLRLKLVGNFEYIIYRATLARYELSRMNIERPNLKDVLVFIEDRRFFKHKGIDIYALTRAFLGLLNVKRRSGGSTITQQLSRTLFIYDISKLVRRKMVELILALWLNKIYSKDEQLDIYLASVRFEKGVFGIVEAMKYYWSEVKGFPTKAESFFLIERVSNINSRLLTTRIIQIAKEAVRTNLLNKNDIHVLVNLYENAVIEGKIIDVSNGISKLKLALQ